MDIDSDELVKLKELTKKIKPYPDNDEQRKANQDFFALCAKLIPEILSELERLYQAEEWVMERRIDG